MTRPLRGLRYLDEDNALIARIVHEDAPYMDMYEALDFYERLIEAGLRPQDEALIGCNDRWFLLWHLLGRKDVAHPWLYDRCREVEAAPDGYLDLWAREHYKMLRVDEPIPTPSGWMRHGDLMPGHWVFGPDGKPCRVIARTQVFTDGPAYEIVFDDGSTMQAGADHLWTVERKTRRRIKGTANGRVYRESVTLSTKEIAGHDHSADERIAIPVNAPLDMPAAILPIAPYTLGAWLGDGHSADGRITCGDAELFEAVRDEGYRLGESTTAAGAETRTVYGLRPILRALGLIGDKSADLPMDYLRGSVAQRLELLRGLMDTDGHCNTRGTATFTNKTEAVARLAYDLATGLGFKPQMRAYDAAHGRFWQVSFQAYQAMNPFRIPRKAQRAKPGARPNPRRYIVSVRRVPPSPMSCIQVDRPDGLYLAGRQMVTTHNSTIITYAGIVQEVCADPEITVCIFSFRRSIAQKFLAQVMRDFERNPVLRTAYQDVLWERPRVESPRWSKSEGIIVRRQTNPSDPTILASGLVDGMPTGGHFNLMVYDDVVTDRSVTNPEMVQTTTEAWELSDNLGAGNVRVWTIGTRYCTIGSMRITMSDWSQRPISDVKIGDVVVGWERAANGQRVLRRARVINRGVHLAQPVNRYVFSDGSSVVCTSDHRWWKGPWGSGDEYNNLQVPRRPERSSIEIIGSPDIPKKKGLSAVRRLLNPIDLSLYAKMTTEGLSLVRVEQHDPADVHWLETETGNYVIEGLCSSNSFADTYGQMLERNTLIPRIYPATANGRMDGDLVFMSPERWEEKKKKQRSTLAAQMLQNPLSGKENMFEPQWISRYEIRPEIMNVYIMVDPASSKRKSSDRTAMCVVGVAVNGKKYLLDAVCHRMSLSERWRWLRTLYLKWSKARGVRIIKVGYEKYGMQADIEHFQAKMAEPGEPQFEIIELNTVEGGVANQAKKARVGRLEPDVRLGELFFPALMAVPGAGDCFWSIDQIENRIVTVPVRRKLPNGNVIQGLSAPMRKMIDSGFPHLVAQPIDRINEDGKPYDATRELVDEMIFFPFSPRDDFVDCLSRIYDMGVTTPDLVDTSASETATAFDYEDA